jgi:hypothetical protein
MNITHLNQLQPGDRLTIADARFPTANGQPWHYIFTGHDPTGLDRDIGYVTGPSGVLAVWQWEICPTIFTIELLEPPVKFEPGIARCSLGPMLLAYVDYEGDRREVRLRGSITEAVARAVELMAPGEHQPQGATLYAATPEGFEAILTLEK